MALVATPPVTSPRAPVRDLLRRQERPDVRRAIVEISKNGSVIPTEKQIKSSYLKRWDRKYGATYAVLDILQRIFYRNDAAREAFVEMWMTRTFRSSPSTATSTSGW